MYIGENYPYVGGLSVHLPGFWGLLVHPLDVHYAFSELSLPPFVYYMFGV